MRGCWGVDGARRGVPGIGGGASLSGGGGVSLGGLRLAGARKGERAVADRSLAPVTVALEAYFEFVDTPVDFSLRI